MEPLTPAQRRVYDAFLTLHTMRGGIPPTVREAARVANLGLATTQAHLVTLIAKGWLARVEGMGSRGIIPVRDA